MENEILPSIFTLNNLLLSSFKKTLLLSLKNKRDGMIIKLGVCFGLSNLKILKNLKF